MIGELDRTGALLEEAALLGDTEHAFRWRHQFRGRLIRARLQFALGEYEVARASAGALVADSARLGAFRYEVQARLVAAMAAQRTGSPADMDEVDSLLLSLDQVAGLESWWITAEAAQVFAVDTWKDMAGRRVAALSRRAGSYAAVLERSATRRLELRP
jgi:VIT1/CCC1 family predicted Fe2+/Mn2+ transporter